MSYYNHNTNKLISSLDSKQHSINSRFFSPICNSTNNKKNIIYNTQLINSSFLFNFDNIYFHGCNSNYANMPIKKFYNMNKPIKKINIDVEINSISDLLKIIDDYPITYNPKENVEYNINLKALHDIKEPLILLNNMIGMNSLKTNIVDQIMYFMQNLHKVNNKQSDFLHTVIYGPPGTGKTEIAKIIGNIFSKIGVLNKKYFKKVTRSDLIAGYLGQTALKTTDAIKSALGGVLFIDEAYALGNNELRDSFAKECIDTLCEALSDHKDNLMVIVAGYENELKSCFFDYNKGMESRFTWRFKTDDYTSEELKNIFIKKVKDAQWEILEDIDVKWFEKNKDYFKYYGRDMETLFSKTKIAHSRRVFCKPINVKTKLIMDDIKKGFQIYLANDEVKNRKNYNDVIRNMYL